MIVVITTNIKMMMIFLRNMMATLRTQTEIRQFIYPFIYLPIYLSIYLYILLVYLPFYISIHLSDYLVIYLSIFIYCEIKNSVQFSKLYVAVNIFAAISTEKGRHPQKKIFREKCPAHLQGASERLLFPETTAYLIIYRVFIKYCVFPKKVLIFLNSASFAAVLVFDLPLCTQLTPMENRERPESGIHFKIF